MPKRDHHAGEMEEAAVDLEQAFIADHQAAEGARPSEGALDFPAAPVAAQPPPVLRWPPAVADAAVWDDQRNVTLRQAVPKWVAVVALVGDYPFRVAPAAPRHPDLIERRLEQVYLRERGRRQECSQRNTLAVRQYHPLRALAFLGFSDSEPPFFAGAKLPSANASRHRISPRRSSIASSSRHAANHTPASSHSRSLRQQVTPLGYRSGMSRHRAPVRSTHKIPSRQARLSAHGRPGPSRRRGGVGSSGSSRFHCLSVSSMVLLRMPEHLYFTSLHGHCGSPGTYL